MSTIPDIIQELDNQNKYLEIKSDKLETVMFSRNGLKL